MMRNLFVNVSLNDTKVQDFIMVTIWREIPEYIR